MSYHRLALSIAALVLLATTGALGTGLDSPKGPVMLVVSGAIAKTNAAGEARFDQAMLEKLGVASLATTTTWTEGVVTFEGVRARDLMAAVDPKGTEVQAVALNDYKATIPLADFQDRNVLLAFRQDGKPLRVRDRGPLWIIYPVDPGSASHSLETRGKMVWQLKELRIR